MSCICQIKCLSCFILCSYMTFLTSSVLPKERNLMLMLIFPAFPSISPTICSAFASSSCTCCKWKDVDYVLFGHFVYGRVRNGSDTDTASGPCGHRTGTLPSCPMNENQIIPFKSRADYHIPLHITSSLANKLHIQERYTHLFCASSLLLLSVYFDSECRSRSGSEIGALDTVPDVVRSIWGSTAACLWLERLAHRDERTFSHPSHGYDALGRCSSWAEDGKIFDLHFRHWLISYPTNFLMNGQIMSVS